MNLAGPISSNNNGPAINEDFNLYYIENFAKRSGTFSKNLVVLLQNEAVLAC